MDGSSSRKVQSAGRGHRVARRDFLQTAAVVGVGAGICSLSATRLFSAPMSKGAPNAEKLGWRLACQAWSFRLFTLYEAIDKTASLGLRFIEAFPGQKLSKQDSAGMGPELSAAQRKDLKSKLADSGVKLVNFGVTGVSEATFEFAKDMGIETIVSEPTPEQMDQVAKWCDQFDIDVAIHNHPKPSRYWNPSKVLDAIEDRTGRLGACGDTAHWIRSGLSPYECVMLLQDRIICFHLKDLNEKSPDAHDVPIGEGVLDATKFLDLVKAWGFKGVMSFEYEDPAKWDNNLPEIARSIAFVDHFAAEALSAK